MEPAYECPPPFPVMLYFWELGENIAVQYAQDFVDETYIAVLKKTFKELGINRN